MKKYKWVRRLLLAAGAVCVMILLNSLRAENAFDKAYQRIAVPNAGVGECVVDLNRMGSIKYLWQPDVVSVYLRYKPQIKMDNLHYELEDLMADVSQETKKGVWTRIGPQHILLQDKRKIIPLNLEIKIPRDNIWQYHVGEGMVILKQNDSRVAATRIKIINSRYQE